MIVTVRARGRIGASVTTAWCALPTRISASRAGARRKRREARPASGDCPHSKVTEAVAAAASVLKIEKSRSAVKVPISPMCS